MIICICHGISDKEINQVVRKGICSVEEISRCTGAGTDCGSCYSKMQEIVEKKGIQESNSATRSTSGLNLSR
jgi:bacterioferritin-associated ferredoxin